MQFEYLDIKMQHHAFLRIASSIAWPASHFFHGLGTALRAGSVVQNRLVAAHGIGRSTIRLHQMMPR